MSLATLKKTNTLDKLLGAVEVENKPQEKKSYVEVVPHRKKYCDCSYLQLGSRNIPH